MCSKWRRSPVYYLVFVGRLLVRPLHFVLPCSGFQVMMTPPLPLPLHARSSSNSNPYSWRATIGSVSTIGSISSNDRKTQLYESESGSSMPTWGELSQQKSDALRSLSSYHDGSWSCEEGALSFSITSDVTGGMTRKKRSVPYCTSVSTRLGLAGVGSDDGLKIAETFSWGKHSDQATVQTDANTGTDGNDDTIGTIAGNTVFIRACSLGSTLDIDSVDASFSIDGFCNLFDYPSTEASESESESESESTSASCGLPLDISGVHPQQVSFVVEQVLVLGETERARCFLLYGEQQDNQIKEASLIRVVICYERKLNALNNSEQQTMLPSQNDEYSRLDQLTNAIGNSDTDTQFQEDRILCPMSLMKLSLGPWLGDIIIRDKSLNSALPKSPSTKNEEPSKKGFGKQPTKIVTPPPVKDDPNEGFAEWILGVQKAAITFQWDVGQNICQNINFGKCLGCATSDMWPLSSKGTIYNDDGMSRRFKPEERMLYIDYDMGIYGGFIVGSAFVKAPRFFKFNNSPRSKGPTFPMLTEFTVFQKTRDDAGSNPTVKIEAINDDENSGQDICSSRITRLYGQDCKFEQGCTSFFTLKSVVENVGT